MQRRTPKTKSTDTLFPDTTLFRAIHEALSLNVALFRTTVSNEINSQDTSDGVALQTGKKRVQGVELSAIGNITDNWAISAGYIDQRTKVTKGPAVTSDGTPNLTYAPGKAFTGWTTYRLPYGFTIGGGARYSGKKIGSASCRERGWT